MVNVTGDPLKGIPQAPADLLRAAPMTGAEASILQMLQGQVGPGTSRVQNLEATLQGKFLSPDSNPFLRASIEAAQRPTLEGLTEVLERVLPGRFTKANQFVQPGGSSAFDRAAALATRGAASALGDIATNIASQNYTQERDRQIQALQISQGEIDAGLKVLQGSSLPRLIEQHGIDVGLEEYRNRVASLVEILRIIGGVSGPVTANETKERSTPGLIGSVVQPAAGAAGGYLAFKGG
jgi:hypothetical protein